MYLYCSTYMTACSSKQPVLSLHEVIMSLVNYYFLKPVKICTSVISSKLGQELNVWKCGQTVKRRHIKSSSQPKARDTLLNYQICNVNTQSKLTCHSHIIFYTYNQPSALYMDHFPCHNTDADDKIYHIYELPKFGKMSVNCSLFKVLHVIHFSSQNINFSGHRKQTTQLC